MEESKIFLAGLVSGAFGSFMVYPIDVIKTRMQNQNNINIKYNSGIDCFNKLWKTGGIRQIYKGYLPQLIGVAPEKAIKLFAYNYVVQNNKNELKYHIIGGIFAGACQVLITNPYEIIKINMQMNNKIDYKNINFYKGTSACFLRDVPFSGIYFPLYWTYKNKFNLNSFMAGLFAGIPAAFICTPADVIKTRMQSNLYSNMSIYNISKNIFINEGFKAFFKGSGWRVLRSGPQFGFTLLMYEYLIT